MYPDGTYRMNRSVGCLPCRVKKQGCAGGSVTQEHFWDGAARTGEIEDLVAAYKERIGFVKNPSWKRGTVNPPAPETAKSGQGSGPRKKATNKRPIQESSLIPMSKRLKTSVDLLTNPDETYRIPGPGPSELFGPELPSITLEAAPSSPNLQTILQNLKASLDISNQRNGTLEERVNSLKNHFWSDEFRELFLSIAGSSGNKVKVVDALAIGLLVGEQSAQEIYSHVTTLAEWQGKVLAAERLAAAAFARTMQSEIDELRSAYMILRNEAGGFRDTMVKLRSWMERNSTDMHSIANTFGVLDRSSAEGLRIVRQSVVDVTELQANLEAVAPRQAVNETVRSSRAHIPSPPRDP